jgi:hypothetical protein
MVRNFVSFFIFNTIVVKLKSILMDNIQKPPTDYTIPKVFAYPTTIPSIQGVPLYIFLTPESILFK